MRGIINQDVGAYVPLTPSLSGNNLGIESFYRYLIIRWARLGVLNLNDRIRQNRGHRVDLENQRLLAGVDLAAGFRARRAGGLAACLRRRVNRGRDSFGSRRPGSRRRRSHNHTCTDAVVRFRILRVLEPLRRGARVVFPELCGHRGVARDGAGYLDGMSD